MKKWQGVDLTFIPEYFTKKAIAVFVIVLLLCMVLFVQRALPVQWILFGFMEVGLFFFYSNWFSKRWVTLPPKVFAVRLFWTSTLIRIVWVVCSYVYFTIATGRPFEFDTGDAMGYHGEGVWLSGLISHGMFDVYLAYIGTNYSDMGYPLYLGVIYYVLGDGILLIRIFKAFLGAGTCFFVYKLARNNFGESTGRIAGVLAMLLPNLIYYCGLHVKEVEMVFLSTACIYVGDIVLRSQRMIFKNIVLLMALGASLFLFRTVLAVTVVVSFAFAILIISKKISGTNKKIALILLMGLVGFVISSGSLSESIGEYIEASDQNLTSQMDNFSTREGGNALAKYGSKGIFLPLMLVAPLPTLLDTGQTNAMMISGAIFTRNVYSFFVFIALIFLMRNRLWRQHTLILLVLFLYLFILASSGFALSERFHMPIVPLLIVLTALGISKMNIANRKYFIPYLMLVAIIIIGWNWFKMAGRGMV